MFIVDVLKVQNLLYQNLQDHEIMQQLSPNLTLSSQAKNMLKQKYNQ